MLDIWSKVSKVVTKGLPLPLPKPVTWQTTSESSGNFLRHITTTWSEWGGKIWSQSPSLPKMMWPCRRWLEESAPGYITTNHCPPPKQPLVRQFGHHKDAVVIRQAAAQNTSVGMLNLRDTVCWCCSWWSRYCAPATLHWQSFSLSNCLLWQFSSRKSS